MAKKIDIGGELHSVATDHKVADASEIKDISKGNKSQTDFNNDIDRHEVEIHGIGGIESRLTDVEQLGQIALDGGKAQIAQGSDFTNPDATKRAKIPTVGAIVDGLNDGIYDISKRNSTGGPNNDGKFTLEYILNNANTLIPTSWRHGGMTISFIQSSDNKYVQYFLTKDEWSASEGDWEKILDQIGKVSIYTGNPQMFDYLFGVADLYGASRIYYDFDVPAGYSSFIELMDANGTRLGYVGKGSSDSGALHYDGYKEIPDGFSYAQWNCSAAASGQSTINKLAFNPTTSYFDHIKSAANLGVGNFGLNIFDEDFELGDIDLNGQPIVSSSTLRTKNFIPCHMDWDYSISINKAFVYYYDNEYSFISLVEIRDNPTFHTLNNATYFKLVLFTNYGTTYKNDVKIFQKYNWKPDITKTEQRFTSLIDEQDEKISVVVKEYNSPQLFDRSKNLSGQMDVNGIVSPNASYVYTPDAINVAENVGRTIYFSSDSVAKIVQKVITYDANGNITNDYSENVSQFTIPVGVSTIRLSYYSNEEDSSYAHLQAEYDEITHYVEYGSELIPLVPCNIIVSKSGQGDYTTLTEAVANAKNGDVIFVRKGVYDNEEVEAYGKDITIIGEDVNSTIIKNGLDLYARPPIEMSIGKLANLTFHSYGVNGGDNRHAYALHNDDNSLQDKTFIAENCIFHTQSGYGAVGRGLRKGCGMTFKDCVFLNESPSGVPFFGNESALSQGPAGEQRLNFYDCQFITTQAQRAAIFRGMKTLGNYVICTFIGNTFVSADTSLTIRLDYTSQEYIGTSERMGNMGLVNWDLTYSSRLNNIDELNIARTGHADIIQ